MDVRGYVESNAREFIDDLKQWLAIPSVSADPARHADVRRSAEWLAGHLHAIGFPVAEVWPTQAPGLPAVFAEWPAADPDAPAVLVYGHHDVQPVEPLEEWESPPFEPAGMWAADVPSMTTGMRGLASAEVTLTGPEWDLHSGSFGGGVPNPLHAMASLLAGLHDEAGRVTLPRFYDQVLPLSDEERELFGRLPFDEKQWLAEAGHSGAAYGEQGFTTLERTWARPTAEVNGMWGGHTGPGSIRTGPTPRTSGWTCRCCCEAPRRRRTCGRNSPPSART
jgi:acetylornithine deacetylase/succinyl-diaminopimelate desuccinylase-like protein